MTDDEDIKTCYDCGTEIGDDSYLSVDEHAYCTDCAGVCSVCDTICRTDDLATDYHGQALCSDCRFYCDYCHEYYSGDSYEVEGETWCEADWENNAWRCYRCDDYYHHESECHYINDDNYCESCYGVVGAWCEDCEQNYFAEDGCDCGSESSQGTRSSCCGSTRSVHGYGCKPPVQFIGSDKHNLFLGIELETEIRANDIQPAADFASNALSGIAILKQDSSIGSGGYNGFEIVTQPHSHLQFREHSDTLWNTIDTLRRDYNGRSWDAKSCGLHIHMSRAGFNGGAHMHRFLAFVYHNSEPLMKFAGRKSDYARFNDVYKFDEYDKPRLSFAHKLDRRQSSERYSAVNTQNRDTLELRFFRGTLNPKGVLACLDLAHAMAEYTRDLRVSDVRLGALQWDWFADFVEANNGIYPDLYDRLPKIQAININQPIVANA